ncbi:hypothetical protein Tco_0209156 [Tanacetum coccineum]
MENRNPIRTLGDYSKPSHEGYRNTIELPDGNNVVPLRSDTIRLVQNGSSFHGLRSEDLIQHLKDFLKIKARNEGSLNFKNANIEQLLGAMECRVDTLMKDAISLMGKSGDLCGLTSNTMRQPPPKPSHHEEFEGLLTNFILDQEEKIRQLKEYMCVIGSDFMQLSSEVVEKLKEEIMVKKDKFTKIKKIMRYPDTEDLEPLNGHKFSKALTEKTSFPSPPLKKHGRMMLDSIDNGPLVYSTIEENEQTRPMKYSELTEAQQLQDDCNVQATNIILHGLPPDVYALVNHQEAAKDIWDSGETLYEYYWRFSQLINDMHTIGMMMQQVQVNTKFLNALPPE